MRKIKKFIFITLLMIILVPFILNYSNYRMTRVHNDYEVLFTEQLKAAVHKGTTFDMKEVAPFDWDKMFVFEAYRSREEMERTVGREWTNEASYTGYWIDRKISGQYPLLDESVHKLVFVKGNKVVFDTTLDRAIADFSVSSSMIDREHSRYTIMKTEQSFATVYNVLEE
ncbi:hypothetical protein AB4Z50_22110 [Paenibacillus sp. 2TAB26]|uniref:hypothetical protein n=1 Tax=Paenibacillus sp. 2TAB26 TaxID=3233005 RepID=UPI003F9A3048